MSSWYKKSCSPEAILADLRSPVFWRDVVLELVASTILLTCILLVLTTNNLEEYKLNTTHIGLSATLLVFVLVETFHPVHKTNLDPAISISLFVAGRITITRALAFTSMQVLAAPVAAGLGYFVTPEPSRMNFTALMPDPTMTFTQSITLEAFLTFVLLFVIMRVMDPDNKPEPPLPGLLVGSVIGLGILLAGTHSKGLMNPIVSLVTAIITGNFRNHFIYWIGPVVGGINGALFYNFTKYIKVRFSNNGNSDAQGRVAKEEKEKDPHLMEELLDRSTPPLKYDNNN